MDKQGMQRVRPQQEGHATQVPLFVHAEAAFPDAQQLGCWLGKAGGS